MATNATPATHPNGIDVGAVQQMMADVKADPRKGMARFATRTDWKHGFSSRSRVDSWSLGGEAIPRSFAIDIDEPVELLGKDEFPNPQEYLLAAMNACMLNTFVAVCSGMGIRLESVSIESDGELDLRGFLGIDPDVRAGYEEIRYTIRVKGDGTEEQFRKAHEAMRATSPNFYNLANAIRLDAALEVE